MGRIRGRSGGQPHRGRPASPTPDHVRAAFCRAREAASLDVYPRTRPGGSTKHERRSSPRPPAQLGRAPRHRAEPRTRIDRARRAPRRRQGQLPAAGAGNDRDRPPIRWSRAARTRGGGRMGVYPCPCRRPRGDRAPRRLPRRPRRHRGCLLLHRRHAHRRRLHRLPLAGWRLRPTRHRHQDDLVYKWFDFLKEKNHYLIGYVIMPNHIHALIAFQNNGTIINTIVSNGKRFMAYELVKRLKQAE